MLCDGCRKEITMYKDIINNPYPNRETEKSFPQEVNRAAQFAPYAALKGFEELVAETARTTQKFIEPDEGIKEEINRRLRYLADNGDKSFLTTITYFKKDSQKEGGAYITHTGTPVKIKEFEKEIIFDDGMVVGIDAILSIDISDE